MRFFPLSFLSHSTLPSSYPLQCIKTSNYVFTIRICYISVWHKKQLFNTDTKWEEVEKEEEKKRI
jgi:hypothetical protein